MQADRDVALLLMDFHNVVVESHGDSGRQAAVCAGQALERARRGNLGIFHVLPHYRAGYPELTDGPPYDDVKAAGLFRESEIRDGIPAVLRPRDDEPVVAKFRYSPFYANELLHLLRMRGARTLALCGIATSGVVLSAVRDAWDLDYRIVVLSDACADNDSDIHQLLIDRLLPRQARIMTVAKWAV